ncbi:type II toxin-antitoxin system VapC family toxin [Halosimplex halophilum]|uniref:type II toxin-antitoxin system VapC family toxin n=1 Tax=Halosimplex halophilum TaxID=2559572 RepID=UPI00107F061F|nr:type II toxin-antitoxin system VapC family toxin [Halosimplex halophilum]
MIQDTSFVLDVLGGDENALDALADIESDRKPEKVSSVTALELHEGVGRSDRPDDEKAAVLDVLDSKTVVPADHDVMRRAGRISGELYATGEPIDREDCVIAATALREDEPVLTRNVDHFERIDGLDVRTY